MLYRNFPIPDAGFAQPGSILVVFFMLRGRTYLCVGSSSPRLYFLDPRTCSPAAYIVVLTV